MALGLELKYGFASLWEKAMSNQVVSAMSELFVRWMRYQRQSGGLPRRSFDAEWRSPCEVGDVWEQQISWQPVARPEAGSMANVESGLEMTLHEDLRELFWPLVRRSLGFFIQGITR